MSVKSYIESNKDRFLEELKELLRIPSVSADNQYKADVLRAAEKVKEFLLKAGADKAQLYPTAGHPIVYGEQLIDPTLPTVLVYGHYDVQPADPLNLWDSPPFEPVIKDGKIFARGASDDKGQMFMHIKALETLNQLDELPCNLKFLIEGEEEVGSNNLEQFLKDQKELLKADLILISDTGILSNENPSITTGLRGLSYLEIEVTGPSRDLHSGMYGGAVANPIQVLAQMITSLKDENNHITIPGFYDDVEEASAEERQRMSEAPFDLEAYKASLKLKDVAGEKGYSTLERVSIRPSLDVNGIWGGYTGEGAKTVLPSKAFAKLSMRLVPNQSSEKITQLFTDHFKRIAPASVEVIVKPHHGGEPALTSLTSDGYKAAEKAFENVWQKRPIPMREGGSIPIVSLFKKELGLDTVLLGFGLHSDAIHSPNENYHLFNFFMGIETICAFHKQYVQLKNKA
jgi:acetylornithine deacetylase/succinyl-diaminopimelate desuccinylase-like protein